MKTLDRLADFAGQTGATYSSRLRLIAALKINGVSFDDAYTAAKDLIQSERRNGDQQILVLMDTLENYQLNREEAALAIKGLIRFLGRSGANRKYFQVRFALPSELYAVFRAESENPDKDLAGQTLLSWRAGDLWRVAAHRLFINLELYEASRKELLEKRFDINDRGGAIAVFGEFLPQTITNRLGRQEPTLAYILRHTQLLPRHLIQILNAILRHAMDGDGHIGQITNDMVLSGVWDSEQNICDGIEAAYKHKYPHFSDVCVNALPQLPKHCTEGDIHSVYNRHVSGVIKRLRDEGNDVSMDFHAFKTMLIETGVIGKKIDETEIFVESLYEYSRPGSLITSVDDKFCVHPLFSSLYPRPPSQPAPKLVYPYGIDPSRERQVS